MSTGLEGNTRAFLRLEDLLLPPPLPAIVALLMVLGTLYLSRRGARRLSTGAPNLIEYAAAFVLTAGLIAALVHALAWAGYASVSALRLGGWALAALGVVEILTWRLTEPRRVLGEYFRGTSFTERCALALSIITMIGLFSAALGPAVDPDSFDYHLGVPLDWLRHGRAYAAPDWFHARLVGLGESMNMLGLAAGTDGLGAAFQAAGVIVALVAVTVSTKDRVDQLFAVLLVVACPVVFLLVTTQKPMLLPSAAVTLALVIFVQRLQVFDLPTAIFAFGCIAFAMASKYSYLLTGSVVLLVGLFAAVRAQRFLQAVIVLIGCFSVIALPVFARNFAFYGDPLSPLLEKWRPGGDPGVIAFAQFLRDYGADGPVTLGRLVRLPWDLAITLNPGGLQNILGFGAFAFLLVFRERGPSRQLLLAALAASVLIVIFSQLKPRFFFEPYLWSAAAAAAAPWRPLKSIFFKALTAQAAVTAAVALYLSMVIFPGALTQAGRGRVMTMMALGYAEAKWLDSTLPRDSVVLTQGRAHALLPRPFFPSDRLTWGPFATQSVDRSTSESKHQLTTLLRENGVTMLVSGYPINEPAYSWLADRYGTPFAGPAEFRFAARSPFNRGHLIRSLAMRLDLNSSPTQSKSLP